MYLAREEEEEEGERKGTIWEEEGGVNRLDGGQTGAEIVAKGRGRQEKGRKPSKRHAGDHFNNPTPSTSAR